MLRHLVLFSYKPGISKSEIQRMDQSFKKLIRLIPEIVFFESGLNISPEGLHKDFTHGYVLSFNSEKTRDVYLIHEEHVKFSKSIGDMLSDVLVFDYLISD